LALRTGANPAVISHDEGSVLQPFYYTVAPMNVLEVFRSR
jgi:hypothetical protein